MLRDELFPKNQLRFDLQVAHKLHEEALFRIGSGRDNVGWCGLGGYEQGARPLRPRMLCGGVVQRVQGRLIKVGDERFTTRGAGSDGRFKRRAVLREDERLV